MSNHVKSYERIKKSSDSKKKKLSITIKSAQKEKEKSVDKEPKEKTGDMNSENKSSNTASKRNSIKANSPAKINRKPSVSTGNNNKELQKEDLLEDFRRILKENCKNLSIVLTPSIYTSAKELFEKKLEKLEFINEQMLDVYARALLYRTASKVNKINQKIFIGKIKKEIFLNALQEIDKIDFKEKKVKTNDKLVCNLYKITP